VAADRASRTKALWSGAATVAVLAVVLIVLGLFGPFASKKPSTQNPAVTNPQVTPSQALYQQAVEAQASGDTVRAAALAQEALDADPGNAQARALVAATKQPTPAPNVTPTVPDGSGTTTPAADPDAAFRKKYENLASLIPTIQPGITLDYPAQLERDITISGNLAPPSKSISQVSWAVHDLKTTAAAKAFVTKTSKTSFPKNPATVTIHGTNGYFGTDGTRFATVSFARGRYAFEVLVTTNGVAPKTVKAAAIRAAEAFPESPAL
jgi:hypothetical protein